MNEEAPKRDFAFFLLQSYLRRRKVIITIFLVHAYHHQLRTVPYRRDLGQRFGHLPSPTAPLPTLTLNDH
jgi:hypothetical protein